MLPKKPTYQISIHHIAKLANVSIGTVDRVIHNRGQVAEETKQRILKIINELNYTPNLLARTLALRKNINIIALIPDSYNNPFWKNPREGIIQAAREIKVYNFYVDIITFDYCNERDFIEKANEALKKKPAAIILAPIFYKQANDFIGKCEKNNIPYIFLDALIGGESNPLSYFGQDAVQSGYTAAKIMNCIVKKAVPEIVIINISNTLASTYHIQLRKRGFLKYFESINPSVQCHIHNFSIELKDNNHITEQLKNIFKRIKSVDGIFIPNSRSYIVAQWLYQNSLKNIPFIGYDLIEENYYWLEKEYINFLICQRPEDQGYKSVISVFNYLFLNKPMEKINYFPIDIVTKENAAYYFNKTK